MYNFIYLDCIGNGATPTINCIVNGCALIFSSAENMSKHVIKYHLAVAIPNQIATPIRSELQPLEELKA